MPIKYTVKINPETEVTKQWLERRRKKIVGGSGASGDSGGSGFKSVHFKLSIMLDQWVQRNFKSEGKTLKSDQWPPFAHGGRLTSKKKGTASSLIGRSSNISTGRTTVGRAIDASAVLLQDTGALRLSHLPFHTSKNAGIGSDIPYSKFHEKGKGVPMRRTLPKHPDITQALDKIVDTHVARGIA